MAIRTSLSQFLVCKWCSSTCSTCQQQPLVHTPDSPPGPLLVSFHPSPCASQYIDGLCDYPHHVSFAAATLNGCPLPAEVIKDPLRIKLPREGLLKVGRACNRHLYQTRRLLGHHSAIYSPVFLLCSPMQRACAWPIALHIWACYKQTGITPALLIQSVCVLHSTCVLPGGLC
jgi:hypothetical protein